MQGFPPGAGRGIQGMGGSQPPNPSASQPPHPHMQMPPQMMQQPPQHPQMHPTSKEATTLSILGPSNPNTLSTLATQDPPSIPST
eukprot:CAMPEP_0184317960 /NCGR_PEP_ID=MMETSP1049-20130417/99760_1 /TAXON_ID=77928 /ORGANISM="Proteomonas sulcata, Strain CCMP704" /LENGTH=84 /DNA_ID=CAMNT_0026637547 /DNA_START=32 /DNA_END=284 /DNA_ORIENTATION=+